MTADDLRAMPGRDRWRAECRCATLQCAGWGHPVTSGHANIDTAVERVAKIIFALKTFARNDDSLAAFSAASAV